MQYSVLSLTQSLIRCPSVTPEEGGALALLEEVLTTLGFTVHRLTFEEDGYPAIENLYARIGTEGPHFCFAGHTDVVPPGDYTAWDSSPFEPEVRDGVLYGRGAEDMKGAIAAFVCAVERFLKNGSPNGSISLLITGDEEADGINGTKKVLEWLEERGERIDHCLVGEPTNPKALGEMIKVGRRGSLVCELLVEGKQGHVAYPERADNPVARIIDMLFALQHMPIDAGTDLFDPSNLEVTSVDVGNPVSNVIPARASARFNIRFNDLHSAEAIRRWVERCCEEIGGRYTLKARISGEAFHCPDEHLTEILVAAVKEVTGRDPVLSTTGGTSDARFIKDYCPVIEFGTTGATAHQVNECVAVADLEKLATIYATALKRYFA